MNYSVIGFVLVGALVLYGAHEYVRFAQLIKKGRAIAQKAQVFERSEAGQHTILVLGDSTAVGTGAVPEESVAGRLAEYFDASVENYAVNGATVADVLTKQSTRAQKTSYDVVIMHVGANDVIFGSRYVDVRRNLQALLAKAHALSDRVVVLTAGDIGEAVMWPIPINWYMSHRTLKVRDIFLEETQESSALYVDLYTLPTPFSEDPERYYAPDYLHLSGEGYRVWTELILGEMHKRWPLFVQYGSS